MTAAHIIEAARSYVGTPFHHGGRLPGVGLDCIGVIVCAARAAGVPHHDVLAYPLRPNGQLTIELSAQLDRVADAEPGDVLQMSFGGEPHHVAIYTGDTIIHAYATVRRCVEQPMVQAWWDRVRWIYRFKELTCLAH